MGLHQAAVFGTPADAVRPPDLHVLAETDQPLQQGDTAELGGVSQIDAVAAKRRPEEISNLLRANHEVGFALGKAVAPIAAEEHIDA